MKTSEDTILYSLALGSIKGVGSIMARKLIENFGSAEAVFREKPDLLTHIPRIGSQLAFHAKDPTLFRKAEQEIEFIRKHQIETYYFEDDDYPERLKDCVDAPVLLFYKGNAPLNRKKVISVVGTRTATQYGRDLTQQFVKELAESVPDTLVVSGLAYGIDVNAHKSALSSGLDTIGVLAHGLDRIYPEAHRNVAREMTEKGGLLSEYPSGTNPDKGNFLARNRIIAGMSDATIIVETPDKGGSVVTANIAHTYDRDVFAFPGRVNDSRSNGCNRLIRQNRAALITSAQDFLEMMNWSTDLCGKVKRQLPLPFDFTAEEELVVKLLEDAGEMQINRLAIETEIPVSELAGILMELEFRNIVRACPGGVYRVR